MLSNSFDVLIPLRGDCAYLEEALKSIADSKIQPQKVVIVDDGITESVRRTIMNFQKFLPIQLMANSGQGVIDACNSGLNQCKSTYVARLDGDDKVAPERFQYQIEFLKNNQQACVVGSRICYINSESQILGYSKHPVGILNYLSRFHYECLIAQPSVMINRHALIKAGGYQKSFSYFGHDLAEDFNLWLRLSNYGDLINLENELTFYRIHSNQVTVRFSAPLELATILIAVAYKEHINPQNIRLENANETIEFFNLIATKVSLTKRLYIHLLMRIVHKPERGFFPAFLLNIVLKIFRKITRYR